LVSDNEFVNGNNELNKVNNDRIPSGRYDKCKHFGYEENLNKVNKQQHNDKIAEFINKSMEKDRRQTIRDHLNLRDIRLSYKQLDLINRIRKGC
jgi:hypothetical protein